VSDDFIGTLLLRVAERADHQLDPEPLLIGMEFPGNYTLQ
jgi:hypothetical protein